MRRGGTAFFETSYAYCQEINPMGLESPPCIPSADERHEYAGDPFDGRLELLPFGG